jgi:uncharacterized protein
MRIQPPAKKLTVYFGEQDLYEDRPLYEALVERARTFGSHGATVFRGVEGFGATSRIHTKHSLRMSQDLPMVLVVIDNAMRVTALAEVFSAMVTDGLITVEECDVVYYAGGITGGPEPTLPE